MSVHRATFAVATAGLSLPGLTTGRGAQHPSPPARALRRRADRRRFVGSVIFVMLLALMALPAPAPAQTFTVSSVTASPASVQPGQAVVFTATMTANQNASNFPVLFSLVPPVAPGSAQTCDVYSLERLRRARP